MADNYKTIRLSLVEGSAGVVAEAIGAGCPVIVTNEAGSPIVYEREGLVVLSRDPLAIADAIRRMINDRAFRGQCAQRSLNQGSFYSEKEWSKRLHKAINEVCAPS